MGITTNASASTSGRIASVRFHSRLAMAPSGDKITSSSRTSPNTSARPTVQIVTKYSPARR